MDPPVHSTSDSNNVDLTRPCETLRTIAPHLVSFTRAYSTFPHASLLPAQSTVSSLAVRRMSTTDEPTNQSPETASTDNLPDPDLKIILLGDSAVGKSKLASSHHSKPIV